MTHTWGNAYFLNKPLENINSLINEKYWSNLKTKLIDTKDRLMTARGGGGEWRVQEMDNLFILG